MKFLQLHYFLSQNIGGAKDIVCPPVQKLGGHVTPLKPVPGKGGLGHQKESLPFSAIVSTTSSDNR